MELNYPVKYALMPVREQIEFKSDREYEIVMYIVSKCYLISEKKIYSGDGKRRYSYEVVFPIVIDDVRNVSVSLPQYSNDGHCVNSLLVERLFDDFDEASKLATKKNQKILDRKLDEIPYKTRYLFQEQIALVRSKYQQLQQKYRRIEEINDLRSDLVVSDDDSEFNKIVKMMVDNPNDFYEMVAEVLSDDDMDKLNDHIEKYNSRNSTRKNDCNLLLNEQVSNDRLIAVTKQKVLKGAVKKHHI